MKAQEKLKILKYSEEYGVKKASEKFNCCERTIFRWKKLYDGTLDSLENKSTKPITPHPNSHTEEEKAYIDKVLSDNPNIPLKELYNKLQKEYGYNRNMFGLYNYLRRNNIISEPKCKRDYSTMFNQSAVKGLNDRFLYANKEKLPFYLIELNNSGIFIQKEENGNPCSMTVYYSTALKFDNENDAKEFVESLDNTSKFKINVRKIF